jgi:hypothetical protein
MSAAISPGAEKGGHPMQRNELALPAVDVERLARALAAQAADILDVQVDEAEVDLTASLYGPNGFRLGDRILDSQELFEMVVTLEEETGVSLLDSLGVWPQASLMDLARLVAHRAAPERVADLLHPAPERVADLLHPAPERAADLLHPAPERVADLLHPAPGVPGVPGLRGSL